MVEYVKTIEGVHPIGPTQGREFTLCGIAFDAANSERDESLRFHKTKSNIVTCKECINIIRFCNRLVFKDTRG